MSYIHINNCIADLQYYTKKIEGPFTLDLDAWMVPGGALIINITVFVSTTA